jgi:hypothetical protein
LRIHAAGVVDEQVNLWEPALQAHSEVRDRIETIQIQAFKCHLGLRTSRPKARERLVTALDVARGQNDLSACPS